MARKISKHKGKQVFGSDSSNSVKNVDDMDIKRRRNYKKRLSDKRKIFIAEYIIDFNAARAARVAGYSNKNGIARIKGHQLLKEPIVQKAINREMEKRAKRTKITQDKVLYDLEHQRRAAIKNRQFTPAMRASELHGKHLAMFTDKIQTEHDIVIQIQDQMEQAGKDLLDTLKQLAGESDAKEIGLQEVKTKRKMKIKKRKKKRPKALLVEK